MLVNALGDSIRKPLVTLPRKEDAAVSVSDDELRFIIDVNLTAVLLCTRAVGPHRLHRRSGKVINIASWMPLRAVATWCSTRRPRRHSPDLPGRRCSNGRPMACMSMPSPPAFFPDVVTSGEERMRQTIQRAEQTVPLKRPGKLREVGFLALYFASAASELRPSCQQIDLDERAARETSDAHASACRETPRHENRIGTPCSSPRSLVRNG